MAASSKPTVFIIHGAFHQPAHFDAVKGVLETQGYEVVAPQLRTVISVPTDQLTAESPETKKTMYDDVDYLRPQLVKLVEAGKDVFLLGHSYGGTVLSELVTRELTVESKKAASQKGGVLGLLFLCAFMLRKGESLIPGTHKDLGSPFVDFNVSSISPW